MKTCLLPFLLWGLVSFSQISPAVNLTEQFKEYQVNNLQEKIFVHTDKTFYLAGEIIWFKIYAVDAMLNRPFDLSKVVYVEILNADQKAVLQAKIAMNDAGGSGSFIIPNTINSGNYKLRAYTKWMKNFDADFFYEQPLTIINTLKELNNAPAENTRSASIRFYPEGGSLVDGLQSRVAFKAVDKNGEAVDCNGVLINQKKDTVAQFSTLKFGMGNFVFTPQKNESYTAMVNFGDTILMRNIPAVLSQGYVMNVEDAGNGTLKISVHSNIHSSDSKVYLFIHTRNLIKAVQENFLSDGATFFSINKNMLGAGISQLTIFDAAKKPVCERLFFTRPENVLDIIAATDKGEYDTRSKVTVDLGAKDNSAGKEMPEADMSMSVYKIDSFQSTDYNDINSYLLLSSELKGKIDNPRYYFESKDKSAEEAADNLMLTQGWRRFKWDDVLQNRKSFFEFTPEMEGHEIDVKLVNGKTGGVAQGIAASISVPDSNYIFKPATSNEQGKITFSVKDLYGINEIILQTSKPGDSIYRFDVNSPYADKFSASSLPVFSVSEKLKNLLTERSIDAQVENVYLSEKKLRSIAFVKTDSTAFYGLPDRQYFLDDYTRFVTMEEVIKEYVLDVRARRYDDHYHLKVLDADNKIFFDNEPLVLIDGVPVTNTDKILEFDPLKIKKIEAVLHRYFFGNFIYDGILSFKTYRGDLGGYQLDPNAIILDYDGLQQHREFYVPDYENKKDELSRIPDLRNQLFWKPDIKTGNDKQTQLTFPTSDLTGKFAIIVQGITKTGLAGSRLISFTVKK